MINDIVVIKKKKSTNGIYSSFYPVYEGFKLKAKSVEIDQVLLAMDEKGEALITSYIQKVKVNKEKFSVKIHTLNSIYKLKFKAKENSELFKKFV